MAVAGAGPKPAEKFKPTSGTLLGFFGIVFLVLLIGYVGVTEHDLVAVRVCLGLAIICLLIWIALLRPRATAYDDRLVLHNMVTDTELPIADIDAVVVRHTLNVWIGEDRYVCVGIGRSSRSMIQRKTPGPMALLGIDQSEERMGQGQSAKIGAGAEYANFVENRITGLTRTARLDRLPSPPVRRTWAVPELAALGVLGVALVVSLLV
jgi:hypothetical protein